MAPSKPIHQNITPITPSTSQTARNALLEANTTAVDLSNRAQAAKAAKAAGRYEESIRLHMQTLTLKTRAHGADSVQAAITFNSVGGALLATGKLDEADEALTQALKVRDYKEFV